jgi:hypothetical protein
VERFVLQSGSPGVSRDGDVLRLDTGGGAVELVSEQGEWGWKYSYLGTLLDSFHIVRVQKYESDEYRLVNMDTGSVIILPAHPMVSPASDRIATILEHYPGFHFEARFWKVEGDRLVEVGDDVRFGGFGMGYDWISADEIRICSERGIYITGKGRQSANHGDGPVTNEARIRRQDDDWIIEPFVPPSAPAQR